MWSFASTLVGARACVTRLLLPAVSLAGPLVVHSIGHRSSMTPLAGTQLFSVVRVCPPLTVGYYRAPEAIFPTYFPTTGARDVFAVGVTLYELVCTPGYYPKATERTPPIWHGSAQLPALPPKGTFLSPALFRWLQSLTKREARQRPTAPQALAQLQALKQPQQFSATQLNTTKPQL